jgi:DNA-directed RNA polymerase
MRAEMIRNSEVERMLSQTSSDKVVFMKIPYAMDAFHISDKVIAKKMIRVAWTLNAPIVKPYYNGYTSLVNGYPILIEKKSKVNKIQIIRDLLLSYYHCPTKLIVESETADLEMVRIIKID